MISKFALISSKAKIGKNVRINAWSKIADNVVIGDNTIIASHVIISSGTVIGKNNIFLQHARIGLNCEQRNDQSSYLSIGDNNIFMEFSKIDAGNSNKTTILGNGCNIMKNVHVCRSCKIGDFVTICENTIVGKNCSLYNNIFIDHNSKIKQCCNLGYNSFIAKYSFVKKDIMPYIIYGLHNYLKLKLYGINLQQLRKYNYYLNSTNEIQKLYKIIFFNCKKSVSIEINNLKLNLIRNNHNINLTRFILRSELGICITC